MELDRTTPGERAMVAAFADMTSTKVKETGFTVSSDKGKIMRFSDYLLLPENQELLKYIRKEGLDIKEFDRVYALRGSATIGEFKGIAEMDLLINMGKNKVFENKSGNPYIDLAVITHDEDSNKKSFIEDDKIRRERKEKIGNSVDSETMENEFEIDSLEDFVDTVGKGKNLVPKTSKEIKDRTERAGGEINEEEFQDLSQDELEKKLIAQQESVAILAAVGVDGGELDDLKKLLKERGIALEDVKQVTKVESAQVLDEYMKDKRQFSPNANKTFIISVRNREANAKGDRMITLQDGAINDNSENDNSLIEFKQKYGQDASVISDVQPKEEDFIEVKDVNGKTLSRDLVIGEEKVVAEMVQERITKIKEDMENKIAAIKTSDFDEEDKKRAIGETYGVGLGKIVNLQMETGVDLPNVESEFYDKAYEAALSENNPLKSSDDFGEIEVDEEPAEQPEKEEYSENDPMWNYIHGRGARLFPHQND